MAKEKDIVEEVAEKATEYEKNMTGFLAEIGEWSNLFKVRPPKREDKTFSNPRQTEFFRAASSVATLSYRMMTAADPFFSVSPVNMNPDYDALDTISHVWKTQLKYSNYRANLLRACHYLPVYGTVICQEDYRIVGVSAHGRKVPVTTMIPRVLDQVMFDRATTNIQDAEWLSTADITGCSDLRRLAMEAKALGAPWNPKALEAAYTEKEEKNTVNFQVLQRIMRSGYSEEEALAKKKELLMYYGKLDCMNDGVEYVCALVNRKYLVRFHANNFQHGRRPFRVAKWVDFDAATGLGLGSLLSNQHRSMDANRQKGQDLLSFGAYNMWKRRKNSVADEDMVIRPIQIVDVDNMDDLQPLVPNLGAAEGILRLDEILKQEFRAAANSSDTMQAIATDATATASSLAQNEGMRAISVKSEHIAEPLVREHLEDNHFNNVQNIRAPFNINKAGIAKTVYPVDLQIDLEIEAKVTTDKDFQPKRLERLIQTLQILTSTKSEHPDQANISVLPVVREIAYMLQINPNDVITNPGALPAPAGLGVADLSGLAGMMAPANAGPAVVNTPVGQVLAS